MMEVQFGEELKKGKEGLDGSLFVFIMLILTGLYILSQVKIFLKYLMEALDRKIKIAKEEEENLVSVRSRFAGDEGQKSLDEFVASVTEEIATRARREVVKEEN